MRLSRLFFLSLLLVSVFGFLALAQEVKPAPSAVDSDSDGLSDEAEQALLEQFVPTFMIGRHECAGRPAEFQALSERPVPTAENDTIYGQAFPVKAPGKDGRFAELRYYHLWSRDCGAHGHPLDTEHVAVLVHALDSGTSGLQWTAEYWYAAAHEDTVCDVSQIARASTLHAEISGAKVWISPGKHASYLNGTLCRRGCGADRCEEMVAMKPGKLVNLGEPGRPMNGSAFIASKQWPLAAKMSSSNFLPTAIARVESAPQSDIVWFNPGRHPAQGIISISSTTQGAIAEGGARTTTAISVAGDSTGNALGKSYRSTVHALGKATTSVGKALRVPSATDKQTGKTTTPDQH